MPFDKSRLTPVQQDRYDQLIRGLITLDPDVRSKSFRCAMAIDDEDILRVNGALTAAHLDAQRIIATRGPDAEFGWLPEGFDVTPRAERPDPTEALAEAAVLDLRVVPSVAKPPGVTAAQPLRAAA